MTAPVAVVTGTDTGVGKTITTAALAVALGVAGATVAVYKPVQAGLEDGVGDVDVVRRLSGIASVHEGVRLPDPMAPVLASARSGVPLPGLDVHVSFVRRLAAAHDHVLVEGAGGLLVELDGAGNTIADLARALGAPAVVVCRAALGTLNHTALTREALARRDVAVAGLVIGSWPADAGEIERDNRRRFAGVLLGAVPEGAGSLEAGPFRDGAPGWLPGLRPHGWAEPPGPATRSRRSRRV